MALDPQIALGGAPAPQPEPDQPISTSFSNIATATDTAAQARQRIIDLQTQGQINAAVAQTNGDYDAAIPILAQQGSGLAGMKLATALQEYRKQAGLNQDQVIKNHQAMIGLIGGIAQGLVTNPTPENASVTKDVLMKLGETDPDVQQLIHAHLPDGLTSADDIANAGKGLAQTAESAKDFWANADDMNKFYLGKDYRASLAQSLRMSEDPASLLQGLAGDPRYPKSLLAQASAMLEGAPADPAERDKFIGDWGKTPTEQTAGETATVRAGAAADQAAIAAKRAVTAEQHDKAMEAIGWARVNKMGTASNLDPDSVAAYGEQLKVGLAKLADIPASGGMRNAVEAYLHKDGYNLALPLTAQTRARTELAAGVLQQEAHVEELALKINDAGLMGTLGGRVRRANANESWAVDTTGLTPDQANLVGQFTTAANLFMSGTGIVHGGSRAGGSPQLLKMLEPVLAPENKDINVFLGNLQAAKGVLQGYADLKPKLNLVGGGQEAQPQLDAQGRTPVTGDTPPTDKTRLWTSPDGATRKWVATGAGVGVWRAGG